MCCSSWEDGPAVGKCSECGEDINGEGLAVTGCTYSPKDCDECGARPCDLSC